MPKTSAAWQVTAVGVALIIGASALLASSPLPHVVSFTLCGYRVFYVAGFGMLLTGLGLLIWAILALQLTRRRRARAIRILDDLVGLGHPVLVAWTARGENQREIDQWRGEVGRRMTTPPFRPRLSDTVLSGHDSNWIKEPLVTLRQMALRFDDDWLS
jgi:hypothetical protein